MNTNPTCRAQQVFKTCPMCRHKWCSRDQLLEDPQVVLVGYQASFKKLTEGFFLFNHACNNATFAVLASQFIDLYHGPVFKKRMANSKSCPGHCLYENDIEPCPAQCECAFVREILQVIRKWPKLDNTGADHNP